MLPATRQRHWTYREHETRLRIQERRLAGLVLLELAEGGDGATKICRDDDEVYFNSHNSD